MSPEYGATCTMFPIDQVTLDYLRFTGRDEEHLALVEAYAKEQGLWHDPGAPEPVYSEYVSLDLGDVEPSLAGPSRPQDRVALARRPATPTGSRSTAPRAPPPPSPRRRRTTRWRTATSSSRPSPAAPTPRTRRSWSAPGCWPRRRSSGACAPSPGSRPRWRPGSRVVMDYLERAGLIEPLQQLGFYLVGYGCTTCIGNSGPLLDGVTEAVQGGRPLRRRRCSRATGTSRGASTPTCG